VNTSPPDHGREGVGEKFCAKKRAGRELPRGSGNRGSGGEKGVVVLDGSARGCACRPSYCVNPFAMEEVRSSRKEDGSRCDARLGFVVAY